MTDSHEYRLKLATGFLFDEADAQQAFAMAKEAVALAQTIVREYP